MVYPEQRPWSVSLSVLCLAFIKEARGRRNGTGFSECLGTLPGGVLPGAALLALSWRAVESVAGDGFFPGERAASWTAA